MFKLLATTQPVFNKIKDRLSQISSTSWLMYLSFVVAAVVIAINSTASIRLDEAQSIWASTKSIVGLLKYIANDVHVPLYSLFLHFWIQFFGIKIFTLRIMSLIFFVLSVPAVYKMALHSSNEKLARITTSLYCLSPFITWYSTETRMYTMLTLVTILSHLSFFKILESKTKAGKLTYLIVSIFGIYTHYFFAFVVTLQSLYLFFSVISDRRQQEVKVISAPKNTKKKKVAVFSKPKALGLSLSWQIPNWFRPLLNYFGLLFLVGLAFLPWVIAVYLSGSASTSRPLLVTPTSYNLLQLFVHFFTGFQSTSLQSALISTWPLAMILLFFTFSQKIRVRLKYTGYYFLMTFGPILMAFIVSYTLQPILVSRYLIFITPTLFYLMALILMHFSKTTFSIFMGIILISNFYFQYQQAISSNIVERENYEEVTKYLNTKPTDQDIIALSAPFTVYPIEYEYKGKAKIDTIPEWNRYESGYIPPFTEENLKQQIDRYQTTYQQMYVVLSYDQGYQDQIESYLGNNLQLIEEVTFSPGLVVRKYKLRYD